MLEGPNAWNLFQLTFSQSELSIQNLKVNRKNLKVKQEIQAISVNADRLDNKQMSFQD